MNKPAKKLDSDRRNQCANDSRSGTYAVGYGKPPAKHRFLKGKSGNP
jgi:hypothetical protein